MIVTILGTLGILDHLNQNHTIYFKETFILLCMQKFNVIPHFILKILQKNSKLILGNLGMLAYSHLK